METFLIVLAVIALSWRPGAMRAAEPVMPVLEMEQPTNEPKEFIHCAGSCERLRWADTQFTRQTVVDLGVSRAARDYHFYSCLPVRNLRRYFLGRSIEASMIGPAEYGWRIHIFNGEGRLQSGGGRLCSAGGLDDRPAQD